jgi:hypothetical protein
MPTTIKPKKKSKQPNPLTEFENPWTADSASSRGENLWDLLVIEPLRSTAIEPPCEADRL